MKQLFAALVGAALIMLPGATLTGNALVGTGDAEVAGRRVNVGADAPNVLIDLSHEFTFQYDAFLPNGYLRPAGYDVTTSHQTLTAETLQDVDVLVVEQATTPIPFTADQVQAISAFVNDGGGLLLVGKGWVWQPSPFFPAVSEYPLNTLAREFGLEIGAGAANGSLTVHPHDITAGVSAFDNSGALPGVLSQTEGAAVLVSDASQQPVMAAKEIGAGRVVISAEDVMFSSPYNGLPLTNVRFAEQLFSWLTRARTTRFPGIVPEPRYLPENSSTQGTVTLYYASALGPRAEFLVGQYDATFNHLVSQMGIEPIFDFRIIALASVGSGYSGGGELGIGVLESDPAVTRILAHELTHSFVLPGALPGFGTNEGWASLAAIRVGRSLGYADDSDSERVSFEQQFHAIDPSGTVLDLSTNVVTQNGQAYMGKAMWLIETLEVRYGGDFMGRLMPLHRACVQQGLTSRAVTMGELIEMMSAIAHEDLRPFFRDIGTSFTEPFSADGDALPNCYEVLHPCLDPVAADDQLDHDADGLASGMEHNRGTDPCASDTDGDGYADGHETSAGSDPLDAASIPVCRGDVNEDGRVDARDIWLIIRGLLRRRSTYFDVRLDVDRDGKLTTRDLRAAIIEWRGGCGASARR